MKNLVSELIIDMINNEYSKIVSGDKSSMVSLPVESMLPLLLFKNLASVSTSFEFNPEHLEYGFDPDLAFNHKILPKKAAMLKEIDSQFISEEEEHDK